LSAQDALRDRHDGCHCQYAQKRKDSYDILHTRSPLVNRMG